MDTEFRNHCTNGNLEMAKKFLKTNPNLDICAKNNDAFMAASFHGHLHILQWLLSLKPNLSSFIYAVFFNLACYNAHLHVAQWLLKKRHNLHNFAENKHVFRWSCKTGHLHVAQWLFSLKYKFNICDKMDDAFEEACFDNHLHVAQWLLSVKPNIIISDYYNDAFDMACYKNHLHLALWLLCLKPTLNFSRKNNVCKNYFAKSFLLYCLHQKNIYLYLDSINFDYCEKKFKKIVWNR